MLLSVLVLVALSGAIAAPLPQYDAGSASTPLYGSLGGPNLAGASLFPDIQSLQPGVMLAQTSSEEDLFSAPRGDSGESHPPPNEGNIPRILNLVFEKNM